MNIKSESQSESLTHTLKGAVLDLVESSEKLKQFTVTGERAEELVGYGPGFARVAAELDQMMGGVDNVGVGESDSVTVSNSITPADLNIHPDDQKVKAL